MHSLLKVRASRNVGGNKDGGINWVALFSIVYLRFGETLEMPIATEAKIPTPSIH
jgi:hypothetical protein